MNTQRSNNILARAVDLYVDGFRHLGVTGRNLWLLIIVKVVLLLVVFKLLFFPDILARDYDNDTDRADAVRTSLIGRMTSDTVVYTHSQKLHN